MEFHLSDEQVALRDQVDRVLGDACGTQRLHSAFDGDEAVTTSIWQAMCQAGLAGLAAPEAFGGLGASLLDIAVIAERIGWWAPPGPWTAHTLACLAIAAAGTAAQQARWLPVLASGGTVATIAFAEEDRWDPAAWTTPAGARTTGVKDHVMGPGVADIAVVGLEGRRLGIVDLGGAGVTFTPWASTDQTRPVGRLMLEDAPVDLLGGAAGVRLFDAGLILLAADSQGGAQRMLHDLVDYAKTRVQFNRPIGGFQAVKHRLAGLALAVEPNGPLNWHAARSFDAVSPETSGTAALAKAHLAEVYAQVARAATESYGGIGYTWEHSAHIWLRRSLFNWAYLASPSWHRRRFADLAGW